MNKIVLEHYPVEKLPEDLRVGLPGTGSARVTVEITKEEDNPFRAFFGSPKDDAEINVQANFKKLLDDFDAHPERYNHGTTMEEAVRRIRELRDEWDDE